MNDPHDPLYPETELHTRILLLREIIFFKELAEDKLAIIARHLEAKTFHPGQKVLVQDQSVDGVYFLQSGEVQILVSNEQTGQEELITYGYQGECFGEMSTLRGDIPASATVVAASDCLFLYIARGDFLGYVNQFNLWPFFVSILASRLEQTNYRMTEVMKHLKQGMVQVDTRGLITGKYSMGFVRLLDSEMAKLHGESFPSLVFADCEESRKKWTNNFSLAIMSNPEQAELILNLLPTECRFNHPEKGRRIFNISYDLCIYQKKVIGMDIGLEDVTRVRELAIKSEELEKEKKIINEIYTKPETFRTLLQLISEIKDNLKTVERSIGIGRIKKEESRVWFGNMHSLKGISTFLNLTDLGKAAHKIENAFSGMTITEPLSERIKSQFVSGKRELEKQFGYVDAILARMGEETRKRMTAELIMSKPETDQLERALVSGSKAFIILQKARKVPSQKLVEGWKEELERIGQRLSKKMIFRVLGESIPLPGNVFNALKAPLVHILRNCAEHGIESIEERKKAGKPSVGLITYKAEWSNHHYFLHIQDNGRGINKEHIHAKALLIAGHNRDLQPRIDALLQEDRILAILFLPGFSTSEKVTDLSGRGVGLDVVQRAATDAEGSISMKSIPGKGTKFTLTFPR